PASLLERPCRATAPYTHLRPRKPIRVRIPVSPSPQPSPLGRGSAVAHEFGDCEGSGSSNDRKWFSLSPRERVGVRGKCACDVARAAVEDPFKVQPEDAEDGRTPLNRYGALRSGDGAVCGCRPSFGVEEPNFALRKRYVDAPEPELFQDRLVNL